MIGLMLLGAGAAQAQRISKVDGNRLLSICTATAPAECDAYLAGVADAIEAGGRAKAAACIPKAVTGVQLRDVVVKYIRGNPQTRELKGGLLTFKAYTAAFPCH
jgi:hypothetical protein